MIELDGTDNKGRLGANAILGVSLAVAKAAAADAGQPLWRHLGGADAHVLPVPMMNVLNGGAHADNKVDFQEFMVVPVGARHLRRGAAHRHRGLPRAQEDAPRAGPVHRGGRRGRLRARPRVQRGGAGRADRRASRPPATSPARTWPSPWTRPPASCTPTASTASSTRDVTCPRRRWSRLGRPGRASTRSSPIEDGMDEEDWDGWKALTERLGDKVQLVGDDLFVTNTERLRARHRQRGRPTRSWSRSTRSAP